MCIRDRRNTVAKIKAASTFAGISRRRFVLDAGDAEVAANQPVDGKRQVGATENDCAAKAEFQIAPGLEADFFAVEKRARRSPMSLQRAEEHVPAHRAEQPKKPGEAKRRDTINVKHANEESVVAEQQRPGLIGRPPFALLPIGNLPVCKIQADIGIQKPRLVSLGDRARGEDGVTVHGGNGGRDL